MIDVQREVLLTMLPTYYKDSTFNEQSYALRVEEEALVLTFVIYYS